MKINTKTVPTTFVQIYAPTSTHSEDEIDNFYDQLQSLLERIPRREAAIILGDFDANVGECADKEHGIGPYGLGTRNASGEKLADFCQANDFVITNTCFFQHSKRQRYTWISPQGNTRNQIDYKTIIVRKSWFTSILDAKTTTGADFDTDHILTTAKLCLQTFRIPKTSNAPIRYNIDRFGNAQTANEYDVTIDNRPFSSAIRRMGRRSLNQPHLE